MVTSKRRILLRSSTAGTAAVLILVLAWEADWGRAFERHVLAPPLPESKPVTLAVHKDFVPPGSAATFAEVIARPLLTPTRQPSPPAPAHETRSSMQRGQFVLVGTMVAAGKGFALLREANGSKQTRVGQGESIKGLLLDKIEANQVTLRSGDETEILPLKTYLPPRGGPTAGPGVRPSTPPVSAQPPISGSNAPASQPPARGPAGPHDDQRAIATPGNPGEATPPKPMERRLGILEGARRPR